MGLFGDVYLSYSLDGICYAITSYGYDMSLGLKIGDSLLASRLKLVSDYKRQNENNMVVFRKIEDDFESYITFNKNGIIGNTLFSWAVYYPE